MENKIKLYETSKLTEGASSHTDKAEKAVAWTLTNENGTNSEIFLKCLDHPQERRYNY